MVSKKTCTVLYTAIIAVVSFVVYFNALKNNFVYDDNYQILANPWITDPKYLYDIWTKNNLAFNGAQSNYYRPMMHTIYMFSYKLFGENPEGYHLINIIFHSGVSILVFFTIKKLLENFGRTNSLLPSFLAALLFAVHPIHTEAVDGIAMVTEVAFCFFYLCSFYLYIKSKETVNKLNTLYIISIATYFISCFFKEPALTLPLILVAYDLIEKKGMPDRRDLIRYAPFIVAATIYLALRYNALGGVAPSEGPVKVGTYYFLINVFPLFAMYIEKLVLPFSLNSWHYFIPITTFWSLYGIVSLFLTLAFIFLLVLKARRASPVAIGLLFVLVPLMPSLYIPGLQQGIFYSFAERYLYAPSFGFVLIMAFYIERLLDNPKKKNLAILSVCVMVGFFTLGTVNRNPAWANDVTIFSDSVKKSPYNVVSRINLADALSKLGRVDEAIDLYKNVLRLNPNIADVHYKLGYEYELKKEPNKAIDEYLKTLEIEPESANTCYNLGLSYQAEGRYDRSEDYLLRAVKLKPTDADFHYSLGALYKEEHRIDEAKEQFREAHSN